jgi:hypothetical protein
MAFFERKSQALFSADCFGALLAEVPETASDLAEDVLRDGQIRWSTIDAPWLHSVDTKIFAENLDRVRQIAPSLILSGHLPAASGALLERMLSTLHAVPQAEPFVGPDQAALMAMTA